MGDNQSYKAQQSGKTHRRSRQCRCQHQQQKPHRLYRHAQTLGSIAAQGQNVQLLG